MLAFSLYTISSILFISRCQCANHSREQYRSHLPQVESSAPEWHHTDDHQVNILEGHSNGYTSDSNSESQSVYDELYHDDALQYPLHHIEKQGAHRLATWQPRVYQPPAPAPEERWTPNQYNVFDVTFKSHYGGPRIKRSLLKPMEYSPRSYHSRLEERRARLESEGYNNRSGHTNWVLYHSLNANEKALYQAMREISTFDGDKHGIVAVPSEGVVYYNSEMTKEQFMQRYEAGNLPMLCTDPHDKYWAWKFVESQSSNEEAIQEQ